MGTGEVLVVGHDSATLDRWPVLARLPPHIAVLRADPGELAEIARHARLAMARSPEGGITALGDDSVLANLDHSGRLFVDAWRGRAADKPGRIGEGLPWDATGFQPPEPPDR
jgi:hypothetical protein